MQPFIRVALAAAVAVLVGATWTGARAFEVNAAYNAAVSDLERVRSAASPEGEAPSAASLASARADLQDLKIQLNRIDSAIALPFGESAIAQLPWAGKRYTAARDLVRVGLLAVDAGSTLTRAGQDLLDASAGGGLFQAADPATPSWLDVLGPQWDELAGLPQEIKSIQDIRARIDDRVLPDRIRTRLAELDRLLSRPELESLTSLDFAATRRALGGNAPVRYLVVFQNPAELRPTGGFPGTMALLTIDRGRLQSYEFFDAHELSDAYVTHRQTRLPQPWAIERFFPQDAFQLHDAFWWPDFPRSAQQFMRMYPETGWPAIDGVVAVQPEVASNLVSITGAFTVEFEGEQRLITADNVYSEIDRKRRQQIASPEDLLVHKDMLGLIGRTILERLKGADRGSLMAAMQQLAAACQRRDVQIYMADPILQAEFDRQRCTGRIQPVEAQPTLAVTYANMVLGKTSLDMRPRLTLTTEGIEDGQRLMRLDIDLRDGAVADEDPWYAGFQRWWVQVALPDGSLLLSDRGPMEDPEAPNGGSYVAALFPDQTGSINIRFTMPDAPTLLVRRQPGVRPGDVSVAQTGCRPSVQTELQRDLVVALETECTPPAAPRQP